MTDWRAMVPTSLVLPAQYSDATITVGVEITDEGVVWVPGLAELVAALHRGCGPLVEQYCGMWSQWLARVESAAGVTS